jgi:membrane fusion protein, macrolide-specific efflux system
MLIEAEARPAPLKPPIRRRLRRRGLWLGLAVALVAGLGVLLYHYFVTEEAPTYKTAAVVKGDIEKTVTALGALQPKDYVDVGAQVSGQLEKVHVEIGDRVAKGDLLAEIDPTVLETRMRTDKANLANLQAQLAQQKASLTLAQQQAQRNRNLFKSKIVSQDVLQTSETQVDVAEAQIDALKAQIDGAQATLDGDVANLGYTKIYAPMAGTVVSQTALEGQTLNANQTAPTILRIADLDTVTVWAQVAEADVVKLKPGMPAYFTTLGLPERRWEGTVQQIQPTPTTTNDVVLYNVLIDVANTDHVLMTSMTAQVFFLLGQAKDVPVVPMAALTGHRKGADTEYSVRMLTSNGVQRHPVKVGLTNRTSAEILSGLAVGDQVIVGEASSSGSAQPANSANRRAGMRFSPL